MERSSQSDLDDILRNASVGYNDITAGTSKKVRKWERVAVVFSIVVSIWFVYVGVGKHDLCL